jgi:hypothetical protein
MTHRVFKGHFCEAAVIDLTGDDDSAEHAVIDLTQDSDDD